MVRYWKLNGKQKIYKLININKFYLTVYYEIGKYQNNV